MYHEEFERWRQRLNLPMWNPVSLGNWIWWLLCLGWKVGSTRTNLLASQLRNIGELLEPLPALKQQQQKEKAWKTPLLSLLLSPYSSSSSLLLIERYLHCKLKGPSRVAVLTLMHSPKMSTNSSNLITEGDLLQIPLDKRTLAIVDVGPVFHISFSLPLSWANPFILKVLALPRLKCDGISESREPPDKSGFFIPWMAKAFVGFHCSVSYLSFFFFFLTKQISNKAAVADMQM